MESMYDKFYPDAANCGELNPAGFAPPTFNVICVICGICGLKKGGL